MIWVLAIIIVIAIYNAERLPSIMAKLKNEAPHIVEAGKKVAKEIKDKAHEAQKAEKKAPAPQKEPNKKA